MKTELLLCVSSEDIRSKPDETEPSIPGNIFTQQILRFKLWLFVLLVSPPRWATNFHVAKTDSSLVVSLVFEKRHARAGEKRGGWWEGGKGRDSLPRFPPSYQLSREKTRETTGDVAESYLRPSNTANIFFRFAAQQILRCKLRLFVPGLTTYEGKNFLYLWGMV